MTVAYAASPNSTPVGTLQTILAVGTAKQINNLKRSKSLLSCKNFLRLPLEMYPPQGVQALPNQVPVNSTESNSENSAKNTMPPITNERQNNLASMFNSFIDNLASRLPERNLPPTETSMNDATTQTNSNTSNATSNLKANACVGKYMRPTSELLDELQRALAIAPTPAQRNAITHNATAISSRTESPKIELQTDTEMENASMFRAHIEIESANHLPSIAVHVNKKSGKRNRNPSTAKKSANPSELQPSTYATFEAAPSVGSSNTTSYTTNIVENSCSPQWNKHFEIYLPVEYLHDVSNK